jgi:hypothetical protein
MDLPARRAAELNGRSEYVMIGGERVMDYELFDALYTDMPSDVPSLCLVVTLVPCWIWNMYPRALSHR